MNEKLVNRLLKGSTRSSRAVSFRFLKAYGSRSYQNFVSSSVSKKSTSSRAVWRPLLGEVGRSQGGSCSTRMLMIAVATTGYTRLFHKMILAFLV